MKNIILGSVMAVAAVASLDANAASTVTFCNNMNVAGNATVAATSGTDFVKVAFTPKCSANVWLVGADESPLLYRVGAASSKGKSQFGGSSAGGAVGRIDNCTNTPCDGADALAGKNAAASS